MFNFNDKFARTVGVVIVAVIIAAGVFWFMKFKINRNDQGAQPTPVNKIENFDSSQKPDQFPSGIPIEANAKITSNYNATSPEGRFQATQVFESSKPMAANFNLYKTYLTENGWKILTQEISNANLKLLIAQNETGTLSITIHNGADSTKSVVDLSFVAN